MTRSVYLKTTEACQLNCKHCFTGGNGPERKFLDLDKTTDWIRRYAEHVPHGHTHFELHGGEPFLAPVEMLKQLTKSIRTWGPSEHSIGATTNLTYKLNDDLFWFIINDLDSVGTSWDAGIRFSNKNQEKLWSDNLKKVVDAGKDVVLNVSVSRPVIEMDQEDLLKFLRDKGCYKVQFERITSNGNATSHLDLFPSNQEINAWYLRLHEASEKLNARSWFYNAALEDVYAKFEKGNSCSGTFCRDCEERLLTVNADGTIGGCPNSAPQEFFGDINMSLEDLFNSSKRLDVIVEERVRNDLCFSCPVYSHCGSDCHRLAWEGDVCASPRQLMKKLAGLPLDEVSGSRKKFIPIKAA